MAVAAGLAAQVAGLELVTGTGELLRALADENPDVLEIGRLGLGALGVLTTMTFAVEPLFVLEADERPMTWDEALATFDELADEHHHVDAVLVPPHRPDAGQAQRPRVEAPIDEAEPLSRFRHWLDDDFLSNTDVRRGDGCRQPGARG